MLQRNIIFVLNGQDAILILKKYSSQEQQLDKKEYKWKIKKVESFLGFANFHKHFIKNFSYVVKPFNELKGKKGWKWEK